MHVQRKKRRKLKRRAGSKPRRLKQLKHFVEYIDRETMRSLSACASELCYAGGRVVVSLVFDRAMLCYMWSCPWCLIVECCAICGRVPGV